MNTFCTYISFTATSSGFFIQENTLEEVVKKIQIKFKILDLATKENEITISRNKANELVKQQKSFEKCLHLEEI